MHHVQYISLKAQGGKGGASTEGSVHFDLWEEADQAPLGGYIQVGRAGSSGVGHRKEDGKDKHKGPQNRTGSSMGMTGM